MTAVLGDLTNEAVIALPVDVTPGPAGPTGPAGPQGPPTIVRASADTANSTTSLANITGLSFAVDANQDYQFTAYILFTSAATTTGLGLAVTCPVAATIAYSAVIPNAADSASAAWHGVGTASADKIQATGVQAINTSYLAIVDGIVRNAGNAGSVQVQLCSEVGASAVTAKVGSLMIWMKTT